jgi:hypothetical protein
MLQTWERSSLREEEVRVSVELVRGVTVSNDRCSLVMYRRAGHTRRE